MHRKKWNFTLPAVILALFMISATFFGALDIAYDPAKEENTSQPVIVKEVLSIVHQQLRPHSLERGNQLF